MKFYLLLFVFFSFVYVAFEVFYNGIRRAIINNPLPEERRIALLGESSIWMLPFGGISAVVINLLYQIPVMQKITMLPLIMLFGGIVITGLELGGGYLLNIKLKLGLWDYSDSKIKIFSKIIPLNYLGQIELWHSCGWMCITIPMCMFSEFLKWVIK